MTKLGTSVAFIIAAVACTTLLGCTSPKYIEFESIESLPPSVLSTSYSGNHTSYEIAENTSRSVSGRENGFDAITKNVNVESIANYVFCTLKVAIISTEMSTYVRMSEDEKFVDIEVRARYRDKDNFMKVHVDHYQLKRL